MFYFTRFEMSVLMEFVVDNVISELSTYLDRANTHFTYGAFIHVYMPFLMRSRSLQFNVLSTLSSEYVFVIAVECPRIQME